MNKRFVSVAAPWRALCWIATLAVVLGPPLLAQTATGVVTGRVVNQATQAPLSGASIVLESNPRRTTTTGSNGTYRLGNVPAGRQTLLVDYTGLETGRVETNVSGGTRTVADVQLSSGIYKLEAFNVSAVREGQAIIHQDERVDESPIDPARGCRLISWQFSHEIWQNLYGWGNLHPLDCARASQPTPLRIETPVC